MAWQTALLWVQGKVRGCSREGRGPPPYCLDKGCITLSCARWQGDLEEGKGCPAVQKPREQSPESRRAHPESRSSLAPSRVAGDSLMDLRQGAASMGLSLPICTVGAQD